MYLRQRFFGTALLSVLFTVACGSNGPSLTGPSDQFPNVAGNYSGTTTFNFPELQGTVTCSTTTIVTQNGDRVSIAPLQLRGGIGCIPSVPIGDATIDRNGSLGGGTFTLSEACGLYTGGASGGFFGRNLQASITYTSRTCYNMNVTINLAR